MSKKVILSVVSFVLLAGIGIIAVYPKPVKAAVTKISQVFVTNWPTNQNVTVTNTDPIPVSMNNTSTGKWEYKVLYIDSRTTSESTEAQLNSLGTEGWEMVGNTVRTTNDSTTWLYSYVLKRAVSQ